QADGSILLPTNQFIRPAGKLVPFEGRPTALAIHPDGRTVAALKSSPDYGRPGDGLLIVDLGTGRIRQRFRAEGAAAGKRFTEGAFTGIAYRPDGRKLYASDANGPIIDATVAADGTLSTSRRIHMPVADPKRGVSLLAPDGSDTSNPGGLAVSADGRRLYAVL